MIQPQRSGENSPLYSVGCVGKIGDVEAMEDGRYNVVLEGQHRFRLLRELDVTTAFRQIEAERSRSPRKNISPASSVPASRTKPAGSPRSRGIKSIGNRSPSWMTKP